MKRTLLIVTTLLLGQILTAQSLIDIYKQGTVRLVPDTEYARGNDWGKVFETYYDTIYGKPMGNRKSLVLLPDASVIVNHEYRNYYSLFDPDGSFVREFGIRTESGKQLEKTKAIQGVIDESILFCGLDNIGYMNCTNLDGELQKTLKLNYMTKAMIPLPGGKIAVVGWVIWKTKFRDFVAIVDYETNEENIIWDHFTDRSKFGAHSSLFSYTYIFEKGGSVGFNTMPYTKRLGLSSPPQIACIADRLIVALPTTGEILIFDLKGKLLAKDKIEWAKNYISVEEQIEIQKKAIARFKNLKEPRFSPASVEENIKARDHILALMEEDLEKISDPIPVPVFSTIIKDSDGNLLFFEIPKEEGANRFNVWIYRENGEFVCQSSFECEEYDLWINPSKMVFRDGYIYALQLLKESEGNPLRLVRFSLE
jgi:hypothetical protein